MAAIDLTGTGAGSVTGSGLLRLTARLTGVGASSTIGAGDLRAFMLAGVGSAAATGSVRMTVLPGHPLTGTTTWPTVTVELGFGAAFANDYLVFDDATRGLFDTGQFAPEFVGVDISADVRRISVSRGRQRVLESFGAGTCSIVLDNTSGDYDPANLSGSYVASGASLVRPMVEVRVRAEVDGTKYDLFAGFADSWDLGYPQMGTDEIVVLQATDGFKSLARFEPAAPSTPAGDGEDTGARIERILDAAGWPAGLRDIDTGDRTVQASSLGMNALSEMQEVAMAELGQLWMSCDGLVRFRRFASRFEDHRSREVQAHFGDSTDELAYTDIVIANDDELVRNAVSAEASGGTVQQASDSASITDFGTRSYNVSSMWLENDAAAADWADRVLYTHKDYESRVEGVTLRPRRDDSYWPVVLGCQIGDLMLVTRRPANADTQEQYVFLEGVDHQIGHYEWDTKFRFSSATKWQGFLVFDEGELDSGRLA